MSLPNYEVPVIAPEPPRPGRDQDWRAGMDGVAARHAWCPRTNTRQAPSGTNASQTDCFTTHTPPPIPRLGRATDARVVLLQRQVCSRRPPFSPHFLSPPFPTTTPHPAATTALLETEPSRIRLWRQGHVHGQMAHAPFGSRTRGRLVARSRPHVAQNAHFWRRQPAHAHAYARACTHKMIKINLNNTYAN